MNHFCHTCIAVLILLSISLTGFAEGTKQILLSADGHGKIQVNPGFSDFAWYSSNGTSGNVNYRLNIHIENLGEKIF